MKNKIVLLMFLVFVTKISLAQNHYRNWSVKTDSKKERIALIIANNHYENSGSLAKPIPTAKKLKIALTEKGFDVLVGHDLNLKKMHEMISEFSRKYSSYKFAMIFYLGHGFQIDGRNYLIPIDANPSNKDDVEAQAINVDYVMRRVKNSNIPKVIVLDACRNNPFKKKWTSTDRAGGTNGFGDVEAPTNAEIFFTTQKNSKVLDNNPYLEYFMQEMKKQNCMEDIVRSVSKRIALEKLGQVPAKYGQLLDKVCFNKIINPINNTQLDSDNDGILDIYDRCPNKFGSRDNGGCPEIENINSAVEWNKKGNTFYSEKKYLEAVYWYRKSAEKGDVDGQRNLGFMYKKGKGVEKNYFSALKWYRKAAEQGNKEAMNDVGDMYYYGYGVTKSYYTAMSWFKKSANKGHLTAQNNLGHMYKNGYGVTKNLETALSWWKKTCDQGNSFGCTNYKKYSKSNINDDNNTTAENWYTKGLEYYDKKKYSDAKYWLEKAANDGNAKAQNKMGDVYYFGRSVTKNHYTAVRWFRKSAEQGYDIAQNNMGFMTRSGYGITKNMTSALVWYKKACDQGNSSGCTYYKKYSKLNNNNNDVSGLANEWYTKGNSAYYSKDYSDAKYWLKKASEKGSSKAQNRMGDMYYYGKGVSKSYYSAISWYRKSAKNNYTLGQNNLALMYKYGFGTTKNMTTAIYWWKKSCENGSSLGCSNAKKYASSNNSSLSSTEWYNKGNSYYKEKNYSSAKYWIQKSADAGNKLAQNKLGDMYYYGRGVSKSYYSSLKWYKKGANNGNLVSQINVGYMYRNGYGTSKNLTTALYWYKKSCDNGNEDGCKYYEKYSTPNNSNNNNNTNNAKSGKEWYKKGETSYTSNNYSDALYWFKKSANAGNTDAQTYIGYMYENGNGVDKSAYTASTWYRKAAESGNAFAQSNLGIMYQHGKGVTQNYYSAVYWYRKAAEQGNSNGQNNLGLMYQKGNGVTKSYYTALKWYRKAADKGNKYALNNLGVMYQNGNGVTKSIYTAKSWYKKGCDKGYSTACTNYNNLK